MFNLVIFTGRLTNDVELKHTPNDVPVATFQIAVDRRAKAGEEKQADFIDCVAWRATAEFISKYFHKGSMIGVEGQLQTRRYEDKDGNKRKAYEVIANNVHFVESKREQVNDTPKAENDPLDEFSRKIEDFTEVSDGDLPF